MPKTDIFNSITLSNIIIISFKKMQQTTKTKLIHQNHQRFKSNIMIQNFELSNKYQNFVSEVHNRVVSSLFDSYLNNPAILRFHTLPFKTVSAFSPYQKNAMGEQQKQHSGILQTKDKLLDCKREQFYFETSKVRFLQGKQQNGLKSSSEKNKNIKPLQIIKNTYSFQKNDMRLVPQQAPRQENHWLQNNIGRTQLYKNIQNSSFKIYQQQPTSKTQTNNSKDNQDNKNGSEVNLRHILQSQVLKVDALPKSEKTTNIPKFLLKIFLNYYQNDVKDLMSQPDNLQKIKNYFTKLKNRKKNMNVRALRNLLLKNQINKQLPGQTRKLMYHILNKRKKQEIILNKKIIMKKFYLLSSKIYRIRCQSSSLVERLSIR